jgi:uncharacterized membrane protein
MFVYLCCQVEVAASGQTVVQRSLTDCVLLTVIKCNNNPLQLTISRYKEDRLRKKKESIASGLTVVLIAQPSSFLNPPSSNVYRTLNELPRYPVTCKNAKAR